MDKFKYEFEQYKILGMSDSTTLHTGYANQIRNGLINLEWGRLEWGRLCESKSRKNISSLAKNKYFLAYGLL